MKNLILYLLITSGIIIVGTAAIYQVESVQENAEIDSPLNALWWSVSTITTVGYGDIVPISDTGKIIGIFYMFFGIAIIGILIAALATNFYKKRFEDEKEITHAQQIILEKIRDLEKKTDNQEKLFKEILDKLDKLDSKEKN